MYTLRWTKSNWNIPCNRSKVRTTKWTMQFANRVANKINENQITNHIIERLETFSTIYVDGWHLIEIVLCCFANGVLPETSCYIWLNTLLRVFRSNTSAVKKIEQHKKDSEIVREKSGFVTNVWIHTYNYLLQCHFPGFLFRKLFIAFCPFWIQSTLCESY